MLRTHSAGSLRAEHTGQTVTLAGWVARRRDHGGVAFIDLRDASGIVQVVIRDEEVAHAAAHRVLRAGHRRGRAPAGGQREPRPADRRDRGHRDDVEVLSEAAPLPFQVEEHHATSVNEEARLKYRYLDLRRQGPAAALRLRCEVNRAAREVLRQRTTSSRSRRRR